MKILIIQTAFIGDVVLATAILESLHKEYPDSTIDFLVRKGNESIFNNHPIINKVLVFNKKNKYKDLFRLITEIRYTQYKYVINVHRFFSSGLMTVLSKAEFKIGFDKNPLSFFFSHKVKHLISKEKNDHEVDRNYKLIESIVGGDSQMPKLYCTQQDEEIVPENIDYVCVAPASMWFTKQFPKENWSKLIEKIPKKYKIFLIGGPDDKTICQEIKAQTKDERISIYAGKTSILESVALIKSAKMTFSNDSAPMHFASSVDAPITAIYCSTIPAFGFGPLSKQSVVVETDLELDCRPCGLHGKKKCPKQHFKCSEISAEKILRQAQLIV